MTMTEYEELMNDTRLFYRLPKRLVEDPAFGEMSIDAKMLYMILKYLIQILAPHLHPKIGLRNCENKECKSR